MFVNAGDTLTIALNCGYFSGKGPDAIMQDASGRLLQQGIRVDDYNIVGNSFADSLASAFGAGAVPFIVQMDVDFNSDYASENDVLAIVQNAVYVAGNSKVFPNGAVTDINGVSTGTPGPVNPGGETGSGGSFFSGIEDTIGEFFGGLKSTGTTLLIIAVGIIVLVLVLAAYAPNAGSIARAVAIA